MPLGSVVTRRTAFRIPINGVPTVSLIPPEASE
jgi:hypothetical protein